jgi:hypothetical protein
MNSNNSDTIPVVFEGQTYDLPQSIAADDEKLRALLVPFAPAIANAKIERGEEGEPIKIIKQAGTKGCEVLSTLIEEPEYLNPAVVLAFQIQSLELSRRINFDRMTTLVDEIENVVRGGRAEIEGYEQNLKKLKSMSGIATHIPHGF